MLGWRIFKHAFGMVFNDLGTALRVSSPIIAVSVLGLVLFFVAGEGFVTGQNGSFGGVILLTVLHYIAALWAAVSWHRYCLLEEYPDGAAPAFNGSRILAYFGWGLLLGLIFIVMAGGAGAIGYVFSGTVGLAIIAVSVIFILWVVQRLSMVLPASAVNNPMSLGDSWRATDSVAGAILFTFLLLAAFGFVIGFVAGFFGVFSATLGFALNAVVQWMIAMIGLSILTTLYGVCVENRELA